MGTGIAEDNERSLKATEEAILNPLLKTIQCQGESISKYNWW